MHLASTPTSGDEKKKAGHSLSTRKIAYLLSIYPAVSHTFFLNEVCELRKLGFDIEVASINTPDHAPDGITPQEAEERKNTFYIKSMKLGRVLPRLAKILLTHPSVALRGLKAGLRLDPWDLRACGYAVFYAAEALLVGDWMRRNGHNHLHVHFGGPVSTVAMLTSAAWDLPYSLVLHGPDEFYDVDRFYLRQKVTRARFVFCISDYCRSQVMKICDPCHWDKLHVVRLGVDPEVFVPKRSKRGAASGNRSELEIVCVGRLVPTKGQLVLLRAVAELLLRGQRLRLRLIGDGPDRPRLEAFIQRYGLEDSIFLEGARSHEATRNLLGNADIFALASFAEGLPIALMEAMAMEIPCVSSYVAAIPELIRSGVDGLLVPPSSQTDLCAALERLIADPDLRLRLAASGRRRVVEFYNLGGNVGLLATALDRELSKAN